MGFGDDLFGAVRQAAEKLTKQFAGFDTSQPREPTFEQPRLKGVGAIDYRNVGRTTFPQFGGPSGRQSQTGMGGPSGNPFANTLPGGGPAGGSAFPSFSGLGQFDVNSFYRQLNDQGNAARARMAAREQERIQASQTPALDGGYSEGYGDASQARGLEGTRRWETQIRRAASESGVPWQVISAIMGIESGGDPNASHAGIAVGLMAVVPEYWQQVANRFGGDLSDPWTNIRTAAEILGGHYQRYGSWTHAAAAYFGAITSDGQIDYGAEDVVFGTTGAQYVSLFENNMAALGYGGGDVGSIRTGNARLDVVLDAAEDVLGTPYVWGGESLTEGGFDCSGLIQWVYAKAGIALPRLSSQQIGVTQAIDLEEAKAGDLLFFQFPPDMVRAEQNTINHSAIYLGNGLMLQAWSNGGDVHVRRLDEFYMQYFVRAGRVPMGKDYGGSHTGLDAPAPRGSGVNAVRGGNVVGIGHEPDLGHYVSVFDGHRLYTYGHLDPRGVRVKDDDYVEAGDIVGTIGMSGRTSGPHVHLDVHDLDGNPLNPWDYIR